MNDRDSIGPERLAIERGPMRKAQTLAVLAANETSSIKSSELHEQAALVYDRTAVEFSRIGHSTGEDVMRKAATRERKFAQQASDRSNRKGK